MITRFLELYDKKAIPDPIEWPDLFAEFSVKRPFLNYNHPGWSPAEFDPPLRALDNVKQIGALVLEYDNKTKGGGDRVTEPVSVADIADRLGDFYGLIHTTRSHTQDWPRFRIILPLSRPVSRWEYTALWQAAARRWPGLDPAPKDASRFWYTPGVGAHDGAEFEAVTLCGAYLDPDEFLKERALATPPPPSDNVMESRARAYIQRMPEAISGAGGHDALWSVARKLVCDFGLDEQAAFRVIATEYNPRCKPPWSDQQIIHKVSDATNKARVKNPIQDRPRLQIGDRIVDPPGPEARAVVAENWEKYLRYNSQGNLTKDGGNVALILKNAPGFAGALMFDNMANRIIWLKEPVYDVGLQRPKENERLKDTHVVYVQQVLAKYWHQTIGRDIVYSAIEAAAHENSFHPVQDFLDNLPPWDGERRVGNWLHRYVGAADTDYNAAVGRWWLISAVARAYRPGCQADHMLILEGGQGAGKSQAVRALGDPWSLGTLPDIRDSARAADVIAAYWLVEIAELDAFKGASMTRIKDFVSQQVDSYRPAYGRSTIDRPRSCVFIGTTNEKNYLSDPTGARRFWPVAVENEIQVEAIRAERSQIWAEAKILFESGEQWHPDRSYVKRIQDEQADRYTEDDWTGIVARWIKLNGENGFSSDEILMHALMIEPRFWDRASQTRVGSILTKLGYARKRTMEHGERVYKYFPV